MFGSLVPVKFMRQTLRQRYFINKRTDTVAEKEEHQKQTIEFERERERKR